MMDSYEGKSIIVAATNHEQILDSAIWRRFDEIVEFPLLNKDQLQHLLQLKLRGVRREFDLDAYELHDIFDGKNLDTMGHGQYWSDNFMYYTSSGIGMTRSLAGFRAHHQIPVLKASPDRDAEGRFIRISDGNYAVTGGNFIGTHKDQYLGMPATGKRFCLPVMGFYRLEGDKIVKNWLPADLLGMAWVMIYWRE